MFVDEDEEPVVEEEAPLPLTKCTVTPSSILYSRSVNSSFSIFPLKISLSSSALIPEDSWQACLSSLTVAPYPIETSN